MDRTHRERPSAEPPAEPAEPEEEVKQVFLRTLYPLNPGIHHSVDFPGGWERRSA